MSNQLTIVPQGNLSQVALKRMQELGKKSNLTNLGGGYGVITYKGKVWTMKKGPNVMPIMRPDDGTPQPYIDVVLVDSADNNSKTFYPKGFVEGASDAPFCWSSNGVTPHSNVPATQKQASVCATCPQNQVGSKINDDGTKGRACRNRRRVAVLPANNLENEMFGGPMMLGIPAASLSALGIYAGKLGSMNPPYPEWAVVTRIGFDHTVAYPKLTFTGVRLLNDEEVARVIEWQNDPHTKRILDEDVQLDAPVEGQASVTQGAPADPVAAAFGQPQPPTAPPAAAAPVSPPPPPAPAPAPAAAALPAMPADQMAQFLAWQKAQQEAAAAPKVTEQVSNVIPLQQPAQQAAAPQGDVHAGEAPANFEAALANLLG